MPLFGAVDVYYPEDGGATAALVVAGSPIFAPITEEHVITQETALPYKPGAFFEREMPPLRAVLAETARLDLLIVDGYVTLDPNGRPGLGEHVRAAFGIPVHGVASTTVKPQSTSL